MLGDYSMQKGQPVPKHRSIKGWCVWETIASLVLLVCEVQGNMVEVEVRVASGHQIIKKGLV